tara:strand:- start:256632 stop:257999 length:1368 start_codon:yes stop_codon:yes gene_type:complete
MAADHSHRQKNKDGQSSPKQKGDDILWPRKVALSLLQSFWEEEKFLDSLFESHGDFLKLSSRDRNFVRMMVTTAVRRSGQIEDIMRRGFSDPKQKISPSIVRYLMHLGIAQIVFMNVPDHAAVNTTVELAVRSGAKRAKGFINAVLRRAVENGKKWTTEQDIPRLNTPSWLLSMWEKDYGKAYAVEIAQASLAEAALDFTVLDPLDKEDWAEKLGCTILPNGTLRRVENALIPDLQGYNEGAWWVQDASASFPVKLMGDVLNKSVADLCAAPGGKTMQLAAQGAKVYAVDRSATRMKRLDDNIARTGLQDNVITAVSDGALWKAPEQMDMVLLDAPCTATGTIRRNPDAAWLKKADDVQAMVKIQRDLMDHAANMLKSGGVLLYCTCSLQKAEGEGQVNDFLSRHDGFEVQAIQPNEVPELSQAITDEGYLRLLPFYWAAYGGLDGFFVARLMKK